MRLRRTKVEREMYELRNNIKKLFFKEKRFVFTKQRFIHV